jgi:hypothetical protein
MDCIDQLETYFKKIKCTPKKYTVFLCDYVTQSHIEYEINYLLHDLDSDYMLEWIDLKFDTNVKVPNPPSKRLSSIEKKFRIHFLYNALRTISRPKVVYKFNLLYLLFMIILCIVVGYKYKKYSSCVPNRYLYFYVFIFCIFL